ncbi:HET-domain-containing protein [Nemania abortiva]|nr:HET-domain-containing protein [Nemania abortiva]
MESLCDICKTIPFRDLQENPDQQITKIVLGDYKDVQKRVTCPFCCLAFELLQDTTTRLKYSDIDEYVQRYWGGPSVEVQWRHREHTLEVNGYPLRFTQGHSRSLGRVVNSAPVALDQIFSLLKDCEESHQCSLSAPEEEDADRLAALRAIDVQRMCVTSIPPTTRYVALSYLWGGVSVPYLLRANKEELMKPGGLEVYRSEMPLTIRDAIELVRKMNLEYLWVDALCLVQDDKEEMWVGINAMSLIYEYSYFTIVAAGGSDANAGLVGISPRKSSQINAEISPGVELVGTLAIGELLEIAHYSTRAWTFQEFHSSRRKLIFHNNMMYYQCVNGSWSEDIEGQPISSRIRHRALAPTRRGDVFSEFEILIREYSIRNATHQYDIVRAVASIYYKMIGKEYGDHLFGVPIVAFDSFMCFYTPETDTKYLKRREDLPSWAWTGWNGTIFWADTGDDNKTLLWTKSRTWIIWYIRDSHGDLNLIWDSYEDDSDKKTTSTEQICAKRIARLQRFSSSPLPTLPSLNIPHVVEHRKGVLQFWTFSARFNLRVDTEGESYLGRMKSFSDWKAASQVFGTDNNYYGFIRVDEESSRYDNDGIELIVISEAAKVSSNDYDAFYVNGHWAELTRLEGGCWYNVLYIEDKLGVAERKGFGQIRCDAIQVSPGSIWHWKELILG